MAGAPKGNKNAKGNRGGGAPSFQDRALAAEVRNLTLEEIKAVLIKPGLNEFKKQVILKLAGTVLPRINEHSGPDGEPIPLMNMTNVRDNNSNQEGQPAP